MPPNLVVDVLDLNLAPPELSLHGPQHFIHEALGGGPALALQLDAVVEGVLANADEAKKLIPSLEMLGAPIRKVCTHGFARACQRASGCGIRYV